MIDKNMDDDNIIASLKSNLVKLEEERDCLKYKIQSLQNQHATDVQELRISLINSEKEINRLLQERGNLEEMQNNCTENVTALKVKIEMQNSQISSLESELSNQIAMFDKLYNFHQETKKSLANAEQQLIIANKTIARAKHKTLEKKTEIIAIDCDPQKNEAQILKKKISQLYREKNKLCNNIEDKNSEISDLKQQLITKNRRYGCLESSIINLKKEIGKLKHDIFDLEKIIDEYKIEVEKLNRQLDIAYRINESISVENRRLVKSVSESSADAQETKNKLENARLQIEELKHQLQLYVSEVKRTEELISFKEVEIVDILCQFKSLTNGVHNTDTKSNLRDDSPDRKSFSLT